jgi:exopolysaccharide biosynthesis polyprenyl glycosylphosphotransferase
MADSTTQRTVGAPDRPTAAAVPGSRTSGRQRRRRRSDPRVPVVVLADSTASFFAVGIAGGSAASAVVFLSAVLGVDFVDINRTRRLCASVLDHIPALFTRGVLVSATMMAVGLAPHGARAPGTHHAAGCVFVASLFALFASVGRGVGSEVFRRANIHGRLGRSALIVGARTVGAKLARDMVDHPEHGLVPVGFVDDSAAPARPGRLVAPMVGRLAELPELVVRYQVDEVVVTFCETTDGDLVEVLRACDRLGCEIHLVPRLFELGVDDSSVLDDLWGTQLVRLHRAPYRRPTWAFKRAFDVVFAAVGLVFAAPLMVLLALLVRIELGPGVLFFQLRVGLDGRLFQLVKFRTLKPPRKGDPTGWCNVDSERLGTVGRFLRRSSLDELPQLWNVLRGQMSVVGPRPERPSYVANFVRTCPRYADRLRVPAGMTGWAQIHNLRGDTGLVDRIRFDNWYIEHWSMWVDVKIIMRTIMAVLRLRGG